MSDCFLYIDPGSGSYLVQVIIAGALGIAFYFKTIWLKVKTFFRDEKKNSLTRKGMIEHQHHPASYRDPAGFIFEHEGKFYRQVNQVYAMHYQRLKKSGLYELLVKQKKLLPHTEVDQHSSGDAAWYATLLPQQLGLITYPYEWCFSQWKDAALLTLDLVKISVEHGMILKDATPFNIQFVDGAPVFIDTLSFEEYDATKPWIAYRQFVECFVAPLLMAKYNSAEMLKTFQVWPGGMPLNTVSALLPLRSMLSANIFMHIRLPRLLAAGNKGASKKQPPFTQQKLLNIIHNLQSFVQSLHLPHTVTKWNNYYEETILNKEYAAAKMAIIEAWLKELPVQTVLDLGANTGLFALASAAAGKYTIAVDADTDCIDRLYNTCRKKNIYNLIPLCIDITSPSPAIGWDNAERSSFLARIKTDLTMALALIHHLAIGKNISFEQMAETFSRFSPYLIIEFVPKNDPKVHLLLQDREDIFTGYNEASFVNAFEKKFSVLKKEMIAGTKRILFMMQRKVTASGLSF